MAINFPANPVNGTTYSYEGVTYIWKETSVNTGFWRINTPGTVGIATAAEIDAGTEPVKYITPGQLELSKYNADFTDYGLGTILLPFLNDLTGSVTSGTWYCPANTPGAPDTDAYIVQAQNGESVIVVSDAVNGKMYQGWRSHDGAGAFTWMRIAQTTNKETFENGMTIKGDGSVLSLNAKATLGDSTSAYLTFAGSDGVRTGYIGAIGDNRNTNIYSTNRVVIRDSSGNGNVWHSGNDGSGSGLDADLIKGVDSNLNRGMCTGSTADPNTTLEPTILTNSSNGPDSSGVTYYYINTYFYTAIGTDRNRSQVACSYTQSGGISRMFTRNSYNGAWSAWTECTGKGVVSTGSNANGYYRIWSDGYKEQWGIRSVSSGGTYSFPVAFVTLASISCNGTIASSAAVPPQVTVPAITYFKFNFAGGGSGTLQWSARGY